MTDEIKLMSGPKALQVLRDMGGSIRRQSWPDERYLELAPWAGRGNEEALLEHKPPPRGGKLSDAAIVPALLFGFDLRANDWIHVPASVTPVAVNS